MDEGSGQLGKMRVIIAVALGFAGAGGSGVWAKPTPTGTPPIETIRYVQEPQACFGQCPPFILVVSSNGDGTWSHGPEKHRLKVTPKRFVKFRNWLQQVRPERMRQVDDDEGEFCSRYGTIPYSILTVEWHDSANSAASQLVVRLICRRKRPIFIVQILEAAPTILGINRSDY